MGTFKQRIREATAFEDEVERFLQRRDDIVSVSRNGMEHTHPDFAKLLRSRTDPASRFVRFAPDGVALPMNDPLFYWEAKCSICIERAAYETYCQLEQVGCSVLIFLRTTQAVFTRWATDLPLIDSEQVVSRYPRERQFPICDGWIYPRLAANRTDLLIGSGTPFREIDIGQCNHLMDVPAWKHVTGLSFTEDA